MGYLLSFISLSKSSTETGLNVSEVLLLVCGFVLAFGAVGEYLEAHEKLPNWLKWSRRPKLVFVWLVALSLVGEFVGDAGIFIFSGHLQTISDGEFAVLNKSALDSQLELARVRLKILASFGPRRLSKEQMIRIGRALSDLSGVKVDVYVFSAEYPWVLEESKRIAMDIREALVAAHMDAGAWMVGGRCGTAYGVNLFIPQADIADLKAAHHILDVLIPETDAWPELAESFPVDVCKPVQVLSPNNRKADAKIKIIVGAKPPPIMRPEDLGMTPDKR